MSWKGDGVGVWVMLGWGTVHVRSGIPFFILTVHNVKLLETKFNIQYVSPLSLLFLLLLLILSAFFPFPPALILN